MTRAEDKYDLQLVQTQTDKPIQKQPWYRERLRTKQLKNFPSGERSYPHLVGTEWMFLKDGLDDFRGGYPIEPEGGELIKPVSGVMPQLQNHHRDPKQRVKPELSKQQQLYSRKLPSQERREQHLDSLIQGLKEHPLALYAHLEESVPPDLFEDLIDVLDKEMMLGEAVTDEEYHMASTGAAGASPRIVSGQQRIPSDKHSDGVVNSARGDMGEGVHISSHLPIPPEDEEADEADRGSVIVDEGVASEGGRNSEPGDFLGRTSIEDEYDACNVRRERTQTGRKSESRDNQNSSFKWIAGGPQPTTGAAVTTAGAQSATSTGARGTGEPGNGMQDGGDRSGVGGRATTTAAGGSRSVGTAGGGATTTGGALTPAEDAHIQSVTRNFCEWVADLGGESNNIDESTVMGLFSGGYESKPALSVPIHVVELTNVPPELRMNSAAPGLSRATTSGTGDSMYAAADSKLLNPGYVQTKPTKDVRYGAWYLKPKQWKKLKPGEEMQDPNKKEGVFSDAKKRSSLLDLELSNMHGAKEFIKFMRHKGNPVPDFLANVAVIQQQDPANKDNDATMGPTAASMGLLNESKSVTPSTGKKPTSGQKTATTTTRAASSSGRQTATSPHKSPSHSRVSYNNNNNRQTPSAMSKSNTPVVAS